MSVPNFSFLTCLEVSEKFVVGWCWFHVSTMSNLNPSKIELELGLGFDNCSLLIHIPAVSQAILSLKFQLTILADVGFSLIFKPVF